MSNGTVSCTSDSTREIVKPEKLQQSINEVYAMITEIGKNMGKKDYYVFLTELISDLKIKIEGAKEKDL